MNLTTNLAYDPVNNLARLTDERGIQTWWEYDGLNRLIRRHLDASGQSQTTTYAYDPAGNLVSLTDPRGIVTRYVYDALNRLTAWHADATGLDLVSQGTYDRLGTLDTSTGPTGIVQRSQSNAFGKLVRLVKDSGGREAETRYAYDNNLNLVALTDANSNVTLYQYTPLNQTNRIQYADGSQASYGYAPDGSLAWRIDPAGVQVDYAYDHADRLTGKAYPGGATASYAYDPAGRLTQADQSMAGHTTGWTFAYNPLGDVLTQVQSLDSASWAASYAYNYPEGRRTLTYPSGLQVSETKEPLGRLGQVNRGGTPVAAYTYNDEAGLVNVDYANGVSTTYETDALYRTSRVATTKGATVLADYRSAYNRAGDLVYRQNWLLPGHAADVFQYDRLGQLQQTWYEANATDPAAITTFDRKQTFNLDPLGNRLSVLEGPAAENYLPNDGVRLTDPANRYRQVGAQPLTYDPRGSLTSDGLRSYTYDAEGRLTGLSAAGTTAEYIYDALGQRVAKILNGVPLYYLYNASYQVLEERGPANTLQARYTYGAGIDEVVTMESGGSSYTYHQDDLGSVRAVTDASGNLVEQYDYDAYGTPQIMDAAGNPRQSSAIGNTRLFTGRIFDTESGNYDYRARSYSPGLGRFLQIDPLGYLDGLNLYEYVGSRPTQLVDPFGTYKNFGECFKTCTDKYGTGNCSSSTSATRSNCYLCCVDLTEDPENMVEAWKKVCDKVLGSGGSSGGSGSGSGSGGSSGGAQRQRLRQWRLGRWKRQRLRQWRLERWKWQRFRQRGLERWKRQRLRQWRLERWKWQRLR